MAGASLSTAFTSGTETRWTRLFWLREANLDWTKMPSEPRNPYKVPVGTKKRDKGRTGSLADNIITHRQRKAVQLRTHRGWGVREIAEELGVSVGTIQNDLTEAMVLARSESAQQIEVERRSSLGRIETAIRKTMAHLDDPMPEIVLQSARTLVLLETRLAKLMGLDSPDKILSAVAQIIEVDSTPERAAELMRRAFGSGAATAPIETTGTGSDV